MQQTSITTNASAATTAQISVWYFNHVEGRGFVWNEKRPQSLVGSGRIERVNSVGFEVFDAGTYLGTFPTLADAQRYYSDFQRAECAHCKALDC